MKRKVVLSLGVALVVLACFSFRENSNSAPYVAAYREGLTRFAGVQSELMQAIAKSDLADSSSVAELKTHIHKARLAMKGMDFWLRFLSPADYRNINGPLPVEWETEVFEKFEKPYRQTGAGLTLAE